MTDAKTIARVLKVLSVPARVKIVQLLKKRPLCVGALAARVGVSPAAVSQHLRVLRDAGLVEGRKMGNFVHYRLSAKTLARWAELARGLLSSKQE